MQKPSLNQTAWQSLIKYAPLLLAAALLLIAVIGSEAFAGSGGSEFEDVWDTLVEWTQGTLGRIIAMALVLVGIVYGVARQSLISFAIGIAAAMGLYNAPTIVEALLTETVTPPTEVVEPLQQEDQDKD